MTEAQAIAKAIEYAVKNGIPVAGDVGARYLDLGGLDALAVNCPPDMVETYQSVRNKFRNHWAVSIPTPEIPGQVSVPVSEIIQVFDDGEVSRFHSL